MQHAFSPTAHLHLGLSHCEGSVAICDLGLPCQTGLCLGLLSGLLGLASKSAFR